MLTRTIGRYLSWPVDLIAKLLAPTGIPPNVITWCALVANLWAGILFAAGRFRAGGGLMLVAGLCDLVDGPVARRQNRVSLFGEFLDSILDRYADLILFLGLLVYYALVNRFLYAVLAGAAMAGAVMVSYARARAESLIPVAEVGFWERPERLGLMILCALANRMEVALWILAIGPNITVVHRILHTWKQTKTPGSDPISTPVPSATHSSAKTAVASGAPHTARLLTRSARRGGD